MPNRLTDVPLATGRFARWDFETGKWQIYDTDGGYCSRATIEPLDENGKVGVLAQFGRSASREALSLQAVARMSPDDLEQFQPTELKIPPAFMLPSMPNGAASAHVGI